MFTLSSRPAVCPQTVLAGCIPSTALLARESPQPGVSGQVREPPKRAFRKKKLHFPPANAALEQPKLFLRFFRTLFREDWFVYAKPAFGGAGKVLLYLGRYTHRVAVSNTSPARLDGERVTFRWKDYARGNKQRQMTLTAAEFLRRFLQHVLPRGYVRIRQFGFLANSCRSARLRLIRELLPQPRTYPVLRLLQRRGPGTVHAVESPMRIDVPLTVADSVITVDARFVTTSWPNEVRDG